MHNTLSISCVCPLSVRVLYGTLVQCCSFGITIRVVLQQQHISYIRRNEDTRTQTDDHARYPKSRLYVDLVAQ